MRQISLYNPDMRAFRIDDLLHRSAVFTRCLAGNFLKYLIEVFNVPITDIRSNISDFPVTELEQPAGLFNTQPLCEIGNG